MMFGIFRKKKKEEVPNLLDLDSNVIVEGDRVEAFRYNMGVSVLIREEGQFFYVSESTKEKVSWLRMIDASTEKQKVRKITEGR